ncbi:hypothetical protein PILCRDRAFT_15475 [Piloderma croceum F 1598]|uniref:Uncharacterized protein n=1 Tax=Piloderma croceum (strain F 1598) TaxID=765440 RepID=A0A0C3EZ03_PILCF|nr:hypothetical protein PILCRDRAFT_15475 [Piloderma croceum F 1598]
MTVNSMMAKQEVSHQQVLSYLVGGGNHYCGDSFHLLYWGAFSRLVGDHVNDVPEENPINLENNISDVSQEATESDLSMNDNTHQSRPEEMNPEQITVSVEAAENEEPITVDEMNNEIENQREGDVMILQLGSGSITASNQQYDYLYRSMDGPYNQMGLYEFISKVRKEQLPKLFVDESNEYESEPEMDEPGQFSSATHPQHKTHHLVSREKAVVPVILGDKLP